MESQEPKTESKHVDVIEQHTPVHHEHVHHSQLHASHLFQEDKEGNVIGRLLIPRPTSDPRDPLTWSPWRKHTAMGAISFFVFLSNFSLSAITPGLVGIIEEFGITATQSSYLINGQVLLLGLGNLFWIPLSLKIGKRPVAVLSSAIFFGGCIWSAVAQSYASLLASRIVTGFGGSASEAMGPTVVADLYFLHERATKTGFYTFMIGGGCAIGGTFAGLVVNARGDWRWIFWMCSVLHGTSFILIALFAQETNFLRPVDPEDGDETTHVEVIRPKYDFVKALTLFSWYDRETSIWLYFWRPIQLLAYPAVFWAAVTYGVTLGCVFFQMTANGIYFPSFYDFSPLGVGNLGLANLIGAIVGCIYGGPLCDWTIAFVTKRRGGYFKPEYRLFLMIGPLIIGPVGLIMWGIGMQNKLHWAVPVVGAGITYGVLCAVPTIVMTYIVDSHTRVAGEAMTGLTAFKNTFAFGIGLAVIPWIERDGFAKASGEQLVIEVVLILLAVPLYIYGERLRRWCSKFDI